MESFALLKFAQSYCNTITTDKNQPQAFKHTIMTCSPRLFREIGIEIIGTTTYGDGRTFIAFFGVTPLQVHQLWQLIVDAGGGRWNDEKWSPCHLMWALLLLRTYNREEILAAMAGVDEKTYRKWTWILIERLAKIENLVSAAPGEDFFCITILFIVTTNIFGKDCMGKSFFRNGKQKK
jgi:hypothetical protein